MDKSITENYIFYKCIVTSLVIVVMVSGELFSFFKNYMSLIIQYAAVTQNINTILYQCIYIYNLCILFLALKYKIDVVHLDAALLSSVCRVMKLNTPKELYWPQVFGYLF